MDTLEIIIGILVLMMGYGLCHLKCENNKINQEDKS